MEQWGHVGRVGGHGGTHVANAVTFPPPGSRRLIRRLARACRLSVAGAHSQSELAVMDCFVSAGDGVLPPSASFRYLRDSLDLCDLVGDVEFSDAANNLARDMPASPATTTLRDRCLLEQILAPLRDRSANHSAERLITEFRSFRGVITAQAADLARVVSAAEVQQILVLRTALLLALRQDFEDVPALNNVGSLLAYLQLRQGFSTREQVRALYLDARNRLIREEMISQGTIDEAALHVREVIGRGLEVGAAGLILAHNHPSGDPTASLGDIEITRKLACAGALLGMRLLDHIIVGRGHHFSFREKGLV